MSNRRRPLRIVQDQHQRRQRRPRGLAGVDHSWLRTMLAADAAEARGDAEAALSLIRGRPLGPDGEQVWRPWRVKRLEEIVAAGDDLPGWARSRWLLAQSLQWLDPGGRLVVQRALRQAAHLRGGATALPGCDPVDAECKILDHDWVFRELIAYEYGGLRGFLRRVAAPALVRGADHVERWADASMGGFRLSEDGSGWVDLTTGEPRDLLDLGATELVEPGGFVLGRVVPVSGGEMFETAPLPVPECVAVAVAAEPREWLEALRVGGTAYGVAPRVDRPLRPWAIVVAGLHDYDLLTDSATGRWWPQSEWPLRAS